VDAAQSLVLVIDDSDDTREAYALALLLEGFDVVEARNGQEGIEKAVSRQPDIIITDLSMPIMDGWETISRLRADELTRHIPIIVCSGHRRADLIHRGWVEALLAKPCPLDYLLVEVRRLLRREAA
jgi:CheY-like chemotaxis protein